MNKNKITIGMLTAIIVAILVALGVFNSNKVNPTESEITSFLECEAAGHTVGESHPRQCWTPSGMHFTEELE